MNKKNIIIIGIAIITLVVSIVILLSRKEVPSLEIVEDDHEHEEELQPKSLTVGIVEESRWVSYFSSVDLGFYDSSDKKIISLDYEPIFISYSEDGSKAVLIGDYAGGERPIQIVDLVEKKIHPLDDKILNATISKDGKNLAYHYKNEEANINGLFLSDYQGKNFKKIMDIEGEDYYVIRWINQRSIAIMPIPPEETVVEIETIDTSGLNRKTVAEGYFYDILPNSNGVIAAISQYSEDTEVSVLELIRDGARQKVFIDTSLIQSVWGKTSPVLYSVGTYRNTFGLYQISQSGQVTLLQSLKQEEWEISDMYISGDDKKISVINYGSNQILWERK